MGVVYHANYLVYFEIGRTELIRKLGRSYAAMETEGWRLPVTEASLRYRGSARYDDELVITTSISKVTGVRIRFEYTVTREEDGDGEKDQRLIVEGHTVLACVDEHGIPKRLPREVHQALEALSDGNATRDRNPSPR